MSSPSQPDPALFTGDSLEEAMSSAVLALGPDLEVQEARRVRRGGLAGLSRVGREVFEVRAVAGQPPLPALPLEDPVEAALLRLLEEEGPALPAPRPAAVHEPVRAPVQEPVRAPVHEPVQEPVREPVHAAPVDAGPVDLGPVAPSGWSRAGLAELGVPAQVLAALPAVDPVDDLGWINAVTAALVATVPPCADAGEATPAVVNGYGPAGLASVLAAGVAGMTPGTLTFGEWTVAATHVELALALRSLLVG